MYDDNDDDLLFQASQKVESLNVTDDSKVYKHICGRRAFGHAELTTVRTEAKAGDWPWHVAVFNKDATLTVSWYHCGGNIMSRTAIITGKWLSLLLPEIGKDSTYFMLFYIIDKEGNSSL